MLALWADYSKTIDCIRELLSFNVGLIVLSPTQSNVLTPNIKIINIHLIPSNFSSEGDIGIY